MYTHRRKQGCRISLDYTYKGMRIAYLENSQLRVGVLLDKGADIFDFTYKPRDLDFMWHSPLELRKPFVATSALPEGAFHDYYYGGWQEVLPSAGWASEPYLGTFQGLHGEVSLLPFLDSSCVVQTPARTVEVLAYHRNGLWEPGDGYEFPQVKNRRTDAMQDITQVLPRETGSVDVIFFKELKAGWYGLTNRDQGVGFGMAWDAQRFPYLWMWQGYGGP